MATIQARTTKSGVKSYRVGYYADGKFKYTPTLSTLQGAEKIKHIVESHGHDIALDILDAQHRSHRMTWADWFHKHIAIVSIKATEGTIADYWKIAGRSFLPRLGDKPIDMITRQDVTDFIAWYMKQPNQRSVDARAKAEREGRPLPPLKPLRAKSVKNMHTVLSATLQTAMDAGHISRNPAKGAPLPDDEVDEEKEIFSRDEWAAFYEAMQDHYKPMIAFMLVTGCRIGEVTAIRARDINVGSKTVAIIQAWKKGPRSRRELGTPKSKKSRRYVLVADWAIDLFRQQAAGKSRDDLLFTSPQGKPVNQSNFGRRQWPKALAAAGIDKHLTPHSLRHTYASWMLMAGVAPQTVQHILGHESLQTTSEVYSHLLMDAQQEAVTAINWEPPKELAA